MLSLNGQRRRGFTLIELLVVIAIIAALAAILFPVLSSARAKARQQACISNLKQLSIGIQLYKQDFDSSYPYWNWNESSSTGTVSPNNVQSLWFNSIFAYVKEAGVYACPDAVGAKTLRESRVFDWVDATAFDSAGIVETLKDRQVTYGMSEMLSKGTACSEEGPCHDGGLDRPAESLLFADCNQALTNDLGSRPDRKNPADPRHKFIITRVAFPNAPENCYSDPFNCGAARTGPLDSFGDKLPLYERQTRHYKGSSVVFADGHATWLPYQKITYDLFAGDGQQ